MSAYDLGLKGVTYMREGSREGVLSRIDDKRKEEVKITNGLATSKKPVLPRPVHLEGITYRTNTPVGEAFITINHNEYKEPFEIFITIGKSGSDIAAMAEALGRMVSLNLRLSGSLSPKERIRQVVAQLVGIGGARSVGFGKDKVRSLPDAVAKVLSMHYGFTVNGEVEDRQQVQTVNGNGNEYSKGNGISKTPIPAESENIKESEIIKIQQLALDGGRQDVFTESSTGLYDICPECGGGSLAYEEGCRKCYSCGYSECCY